MSIVVSWSKALNQTNFNSYRVFRGSTRDNVFDNPPIATIEDIDTLQFIDESAVLDTIYFYSVGVATSSGIFKSKITPMSQTLYPGELGASIVKGDSDFGFIGEASRALFITAENAVIERVNQGEYKQTIMTTPLLLPEGSLVFNKFIVNGRYLYVPSAYSRRGLSAVVKDVFTKTIKPLIDDPLFINYEGTKYKIVILTMKQALDLHLSASLMMTGRPKRFVKAQVVGTVLGAQSGCYCAPDDEGRIVVTAANSTATPTFYKSDSTDSTTLLPIAWALTPVGSE